jgi:YggT family protein
LTIALLGIASGNPFYVLGQLYVIVLVVRAVLSWFPMSPNSALAPVARIAFVLTEPVVAPFRRLIPPVGGLDLSFLVAFIVVELIVSNVLSRL